MIVNGMSIYENELMNNEELGRRSVEQCTNPVKERAYSRMHTRCNESVKSDK